MLRARGRPTPYTPVITKMLSSRLAEGEREVSLLIKLIRFNDIMAKVGTRRQITDRMARDLRVRSIA